MTSRHQASWRVMAACALSLSACSGRAPHPGTAPPPAATNSAADIELIASLLEQGKEAAARKQLAALLKRDPGNASARLLSDSINQDPKQLLGPTSYPYIVRTGDTIVGLAERFLGNRLKAYQLGRYNGLTAPFILTAGQTLHIPGELPRAEPVRRSAPAQPVAVPKTAKPKPATRPAPAAPSKTAANPAAARAARTAGLAALNQGAVQRAVALLRRAAALDPTNPLITRDLGRAERIAATVKAHR